MTSNESAMEMGTINVPAASTTNRLSAAAISTTSTQNAAPNGQNGGEKIGSWLCADGPYRDYIEALSASNPGLKNPDPNNKDGPLTPDAQVVLLDASAEGQPEFKEYKFDDDIHLQSHFDSTTHDHDRRRIYIMEGLSPKFVATIGGHFFMEPTFFQRQERTCVWSTDFTPVSDALPQPSLLDPEKSFHLQYCELRQFNQTLENRYFFCSQTRRHVGMTASRKKENSTVGILRRKVSWWRRKTGDNGWDVVILCDPQLKKLSVPPKQIDKGGKQPREIKDVDSTLSNVAFQGGYIDFIPPLPYDKIKTKRPHPHECMLSDLVHYFQQHSDQISPEAWATPEAPALFLKKIVAAYYLQLVDYIKVMLPSLEVRLITAWVEEQDQWKSLQTISRRCGNYSDDIEDALLSLGYPLEGQLNIPTKLYTPGWSNCEKDFQYAYYRLKTLKERADDLIQAMTGLASIAGNRQNLEEAKRVKRLNILALLFIPLAYTSSLFGMENDYAPNQPDFWVYWVCAIGVVVFTAVVTWVLDSALNEEAQWALKPLRSKVFGSQGKEQKKEGMKRKATDIFA